MCFVNDHVLPLDPLERGNANDQPFVCGKTNIKLFAFQDLNSLVSGLHLGIKVQYSEERCPLGKLSLPVGYRRLGCDDQVRTSDLLELVQKG